MLSSEILVMVARRKLNCCSGSKSRILYLFFIQRWIFTDPESWQWDLDPEKYFNFRIKHYYSFLRQAVIWT